MAGNNMLGKMRTARDMANSISDFVNVYGFDAVTFVDAVVHRTHRTLQQSLGGLMMKCIIAWSESHSEGNFDARNEDICKLSHDIVDAMKEKHGDDWLYLRHI